MNKKGVTFGNGDNFFETCLLCVATNVLTNGLVDH
jgi:hypothetical protein